MSQLNRVAPELLRSTLEDRVLLFVGPQIGIQAGLNPLGRIRAALGEAMRGRVGADEAAELEAFLARADAPTLAQAARLELGPEEYHHLLAAAAEAQPGLPPSLLYALRGLPIRRWLTTNIDHLAERALAGFGDDSPTPRLVITDAEEAVPLPDAGDAPLLVKLFGDVSRPASLVLATDDYETYFRRRPALTERLTTLLTTHTPLFVGYHLDDPELLRLYSFIGPRLTEHKRRAWAVTSGVSSFEVPWWQRRGLRVVACDGPAGEEAFIRELVRQVAQHHYPGEPAEADGSPLAVGGSAAASSPIHALLDAQLAWASRAWVLAPDSSGASPLTDWIPTALTEDVGGRTSREHHLSTLLAEAGPTAPAHLQASKTLAIEQIVARGGRAILLGPHGSGKTSLLLHLLALWTEEARQGGGRTLAFYLPVRWLAPAEYDPEPDLIGRLTAHLARLTPEVPPSQIQGVLEHALAEDRALLLLDGLDEVAPHELKAVLGVLERLRRAYRDANVLMTCLSDAFTPDLLPDVPTFSLLPLGDDAQASLVRRRLHAAPARAEALLGLLRAGGSALARARASNPLDLALLADSFGVGRDLPASRSALYLRAAQGSLRGEVRADTGGRTAWELLKIASAVALADLEEPGQPLVEARLLQLVAAASAQEGASPADTTRILDRLRDPGPLLMGPTVGGTWVFRHALLQESLAAWRLTEGGEGVITRALAAHAGDPRWRGVWLALAEMVPDATALCRALTAGDPRTDGPALLGRARRLDPQWLRALLTRPDALAGELALALAEPRAEEDRLHLGVGILEADRGRFQAEGGRLDAPVVWRALEMLGDLAAEGGRHARAAAAALADWRAPTDEGRPLRAITIPAGRSLFGRDGDPPCTRFVDLPAFTLAEAPTTVAQFRAFHPAHVMAGAGEPFTDAHHPAVGMSWYEASVCAAWYGGRLPTEIEWDKAAAWSPRAGRRRTYPWGDTWNPAACNTLELWEGGQGSTTPVDQFGDAGASAYGCRDMAGNVMEWTQTAAGEQGQRRVLRGGSWMASASFARCGASVWLKPGLRNLGLGFRIAWGG